MPAAGTQDWRKYDLSSSMRQFHLCGARTDVVNLPAGLELGSTAFQRRGADLMLIGDNGTTVIIREYFLVGAPPVLRARDGDTVPGTLGRILVNLSGRAVSVLMAGAQNPAFQAAPAPSH